MTNSRRSGVSLMAGLLFLYGGNLIAGDATPASSNFPKPELFEPDVAVLLFVGSFKYDTDTTKLFPPDSYVMKHSAEVDLSGLTSYKLKFILIRPNKDKMHLPPAKTSNSDDTSLFDAGSKIAIFQDVNPYPKPATTGTATGKEAGNGKTPIKEGGGWFFSPTITQAVNNAF